MQVGAYTLRVKVVHAGTRSEGRIGKLFRGDEEIRAAQVGDTIEVAPGGPVLVFLGDERPHAWSVSGWALQGHDPE
jgi:hypothetical protein